MYVKQNETWKRIPRIYHPAHNVYCDENVEPGVCLSTENEWWYDNETGIWWHSSATDGLKIARRNCTPEKISHHGTWTSPENVKYTAVLYNTVRHYQMHCDCEEVPNCIKLEVVDRPMPSYEHPTSLVEQNGTWVPHRRIYFGVPSNTPIQSEGESSDIRCSKCWWYLSSVSIGDLEESCRIEMSHKDKTQLVAFGPLHLDTILGFHYNYCIDDIWIAQSDKVTPPSYHQFKYKLADWTCMDF